MEPRSHITETHRSTVRKTGCDVDGQDIARAAQRHLPRPLFCLTLVRHQALIPAVRCFPSSTSSSDLSVHLSHYQQPGTNRALNRLPVFVVVHAKRSFSILTDGPAAGQGMQLDMVCLAQL